MPCDAGGGQRKPISEQIDQTRLRQKGLAAESGNRGGWEIAYSDAARARIFGAIGKSFSSSMWLQYPSTNPTRGQKIHRVLGRARWAKTRVF